MTQSLTFGFKRLTNLTPEIFSDHKRARVSDAADRGQAPLYILLEGEATGRHNILAGLPSYPILLPLQHRSICLSLDDKGNISRYSPIRSLQFTLMSVGRGCLKTSHGARFLRSFAILQTFSSFCVKLRCIQFRILATSSAEMVRVGRQVHVRAHFTTTDEPTLLPIGHDMGKQG